MLVGRGVKSQTLENEVYAATHVLPKLTFKTSKPRNLKTSKPHNLETSKPQNLKTSKPQNLNPTRLPLGVRAFVR